MPQHSETGVSRVSCWPLSWLTVDLPALRILMSYETGPILLLTLETSSVDHLVMVGRHRHTHTHRERERERERERTNDARVSLCLNCLCVFTKRRNCGSTDDDRVVKGFSIFPMLLVGEIRGHSTRGTPLYPIIAIHAHWHEHPHCSRKNCLHR
ncbi:hypothetical protein BDV40DRAFT_145593 [Aspergillus tamarii]|uniref:Uncharacterized protein n=1 Tax=Aspergillus tamarii TaxID=41984 RepID=A0A5N6UXN1_ASPTM|nr:hypothetical protein BDV40DRAFT_145593 [Aspergillus tamarii]